MNSINKPFICPFSHLFICSLVKRTNNRIKVIWITEGILHAFIEFWRGRWNNTFSNQINKGKRGINGSVTIIINCDASDEKELCAGMVEKTLETMIGPPFFHLIIWSSFAKDLLIKLGRRNGGGWDPEIGCWWGKVWKMKAHKFEFGPSKNSRIQTNKNC